MEFARMSRKKWRFAPTEVKRAIKLVLQAGLPVSEVSIEADGAIRIHTTDSATTTNHANPLDKWLGEHPDAGQAQGHQ
jgi:hypothetical protein